MSKRALKFVFGFHNYCGFLYLKYRNGRFYTSKLFAFWIILRVVIIITVSIYVTKNEDFKSSVFKKELVKLKNISIFTKLLINISSIINLAGTSFLNIICLWKRKQILNLFNKCIEFTLEEQSQKKFQKTSTRNSLLILIYLFLFLSIKFVTQMKYSVSSIFVSAFLTHPLVVILNFLCFMKNSEIFFVLLLEQFERDLKKFSLKIYFNGQLYQKLIRKYQNIYELNKEYGKAFGAQITYMTCCISVLLTLQVNTLNCKTQ